MPVSFQTKISGDVCVLSPDGKIVIGDEVAAFEEEFASYCRARYAIAVNSGTSALHLSMLAAHIGPGARADSRADRRS